MVIAAQIQQGGVASRAGNLYDATIGRRLSREVLNFGFAGVSMTAACKRLFLPRWAVLLTPTLFERMGTMISAWPNTSSRSTPR